MHTKFSAYVIVLDVANIDKHGMSSQFFQYSLRVNVTGSTEILESLVKPLIDFPSHKGLCDGKSHDFQQDSASCSQSGGDPRLDGCHYERI